jgi:hypothetical protein
MAVGGEPLNQRAVPAQQAVLRQQQTDGGHRRPSRLRERAGFQSAANSARTGAR